MKIKGLIDEDLVNYRLCSMYIVFPKCSFKCGIDKCQNFSLLADAPIIDIKVEDICERYKNNSLSKAIVLAGLEPFDSPFDLMTLIDCFRNKYDINDDIVIYTGYTEDDFMLGVQPALTTVYSNIMRYKNIIVKFGGYVPGDEPHFDEVLGVNLASDNQYAKRIS